MISHRVCRCLALTAGAVMPFAAAAQVVDVKVTIQNFAPANSVSFAPLRVGFNNGTFDAFNTGAAANAATVSIAEGGSGSAWFPAFQAADPTAVLGTVGGALLPGATATNTFRVNAAVNRFFTFANMVIPSNDLFLGNDNPQAFQLLDVTGNLLIPTINQFGSSIWNAGSELPIPANAAFLVGGVNANRVAENGVVRFDASELNAYTGLTTAAGYVFNPQIVGSDNIFRISFEVTQVPEPGSAGLLGAAAAGWAAWRRWRRQPLAVAA